MLNRLSLVCTVLTLKRFYRNLLANKMFENQNIIRKLQKYGTGMKNV